MIDPLEQRLGEWMRDAGRFDPSAVRDVVRGAQVPARQRGVALHGRTVARFVVVAAALLAVMVGIGLSAGTLGPKPTPPDPHAFAGDPRLERCAATGIGQPSYAFELAHASDFQRVFPAALRTPELERADPAFVVVLSQGRGQGIGGGAPGGGSPEASDEGRSICVIVGTGPDAELNLYSDVDITGFDPELVRRLGPEPVTTGAPASSAVAVPLRTWAPPSPEACPMARTEGTLVRQPQSGAGLRDHEGAVWQVIWPTDYTARDEGGRVVVYDGGGNLIAREGDLVEIGGQDVGDGTWLGCGGMSTIAEASPSLSPPPAESWGPLAVIPPQDGWDTARTEGTIHITDRCVLLDGPGEQALLVWPADRTSWDASRPVIRFNNDDGTTATIADGDAAVLGGSGGTFVDDGTTYEVWRKSITWVTPPASCEVDGYWFVGDARPTAPSVQSTASVPSGTLAIGHDQAISIARGAAGDIHPWLRDYPVITAEIRPYGEVMSWNDPIPAPDLPDERAVWLVMLFSSASGQGATVLVDATTGAVVQAVSWIS